MLDDNMLVSSGLFVVGGVLLVAAVCCACKVRMAIVREMGKMGRGNTGNADRSRIESSKFLLFNSRSWPIYQSYFEIQQFYRITKLRRLAGVKRGPIILSNLGFPDFCYAVLSISRTNHVRLFCIMPPSHSGGPIRLQYSDA